MEMMFFVLIGVAFFGLLVWNLLLSASLRDVRELLHAGYNRNEGYYEANKERIRCSNSRQDAIIDGMGLIMDHLGIEIVHTPAKDEVVAMEKEQCCKKEKAK